MRQSKFKQTYLHGYILAQCSHICKILMYLLKFIALIKVKKLACVLLKDTGWESSYHVSCFYNILIFQKNTGLSQFGGFLLGAVDSVLYPRTYFCTWSSTGHFPSPIFWGYVHIIPKIRPGWYFAVGWL